jgi:Kef-type K+ transport system membrane component KefB
MLEYGFNKTEYGKGILGACFINDLGTVIGLGLIFAPFTYKTIVFLLVTVAVIFILPFITKFLISRFAYKTAAVRAKWILFVLLSMGVLALWSDSEPVLPAYIIGMVLARTMEQDGHFVRRLRTLTVGFLTPLYFLRAGALMTLPALIAAPFIFIILFGGKIFTKIFGLYPTIRNFKKHKKERWYYTLLMSTGLTFGTISALFGLSHNIINQEQYSLIVGVVIASAVIPTLIANKFFLPKHLLEQPVLDDQAPDEKDIENKL